MCWCGPWVGLVWVWGWVGGAGGEGLVLTGGLGLVLHGDEAGVVPALPEPGAVHPRHEGVGLEAGVLGVPGPACFKKKYGRPLSKLLWLSLKALQASMNIGEGACRLAVPPTARPAGRRAAVLLRQLHADGRRRAQRELGADFAAGPVQFGEKQSIRRLSGSVGLQVREASGGCQKTHRLPANAASSVQHTDNTRTTGGQSHTCRTSWFRPGRPACGRCTASPARPVR